MSAESSRQDRDPTLVERLLDRQHDGWRRGERPLVEALVAGHPSLAGDREGLLDLLCNEMELRASAGETLRLEEYQKRFPDLGDDLRKQFEVFAALGPMDTVRESTAPRGDGAIREGSAPSDEPPIPPPTAAPFPAIEGYEILGELGKGGMGIVFKARQTAADRVVALKMILNGFADEEARARFRTEAHVIARLQHPHVVQVFEVGDYGGVPFFSLEFCAGGSLEARLQASPLPPAEAARLVEMLARAMHQVHGRQVVHRDLKPANVLLTEDGTPKITDFGLARKLDEAVRTQTGAVMGTPSYMAPEQASGESKGIGPGTDVYALGAILYECLTGRPPFKAATVLDTLMQVRNDDPVPPRQLQSETPRDLETICLKCLEKQPGRRYGTALELADDLRRCQAGEPIAARAVGKLERAWRWGRRNPKDAALIAAGLLAVVLGAAVYFWIAGVRQAARVKAAADAERNLAQAELLWNQAKPAPVGDLLPWEKAFNAARSAQQGIDPNAVDEATRQRVEAAFRGIAAEKREAETKAAAAAKDAQMKAELEKLAEDKLRRTTPEGMDVLVPASDHDYEEVFRDYYDLDLGRLKEAEDRIRNSAIKPELIAAVDAWIPLRPDEPARRELAELADRLDEPDPFLHELRDALVKRDRDRMRELAKRDVAAIPARQLAALGRALANGKAPEEAALLLRSAQQRYPDDFGVNYELGACLLSCRNRIGFPRSAEAIGFCRAAVALRPEDLAARVALAVALRSEGKLGEAAEEYRAAYRIDPTFAWTHYYCGEALQSQGKLGEAAEEYHAAMRLDPTISAHDSRGAVLQSQGKLGEAVEEYRAALQRDTKDATAGHGLCVALAENGDFAGALSEFQMRRDLLAPIYGGRLLIGNGRPIEEMLKLESKLTAVLKGEAKPSDAREGCDLAWIGLAKKQYSEAAYLYAVSFDEQPALADLPDARFNAARAAAMAGCGQEKNAGRLSDGARAGLRKKALAWLLADLSSLTPVIPFPDRQSYARAAWELRLWQCHVDFAGVRDEAELKKLPEDEQAAWRKFWADVAAAVDRAENQ